MQVTETLSEGLKREYKVVVPASELEQQGYAEYRSEFESTPTNTTTTDTEEQAS